MKSSRLIRQFERAAYAWPQVTRDKAAAFGEYSYNAAGKVFAYFKDDDLLVLYRTTHAERQELAYVFGATPHKIGGLENRLWWSIPLSEENLPELLPQIHRCYERAIAGTNYSE